MSEDVVTAVTERQEELERMYTVIWQTAQARLELNQN